MTGILEPLLVVFGLALAAPLLHRSRPGWSGPLFALVTFAICGWYLALGPSISEGSILELVFPWLGSLGVSLSFRIDGLSLLFLILITGIGGLILLYAGAYMRGDARLGRLYGLLLFFMGAMMGMVLAGDLILLFVFWELTGIASYLLIGFDSRRAEARAAALQALLVTGSGGLVMLAGFILLGAAAGSFELRDILSTSGSVQQHPLYVTILLLVLAGAFTKSAQFPVHFWLPGAMEAPTPVSAYLHSATMVKAGVYLLARLLPVLGWTSAWHDILTAVGTMTMIVGATVGFVQRDMKKMLAYTTVSALGTLVMLLGIGTTESVTAACVFILVHALYKAALFLVTGTIEHETGTRDIERLGGLGKIMPVTAATAGLAALSMAGLPPMLGFISKELMYEAKLLAPELTLLVTVFGVAANVLLVACAAIIMIRVFLGNRPPDLHGHEVHGAMLVGPGLLALAGLAIGLMPETTATLFLTPALRTIHPETSNISLALWHGVNPVLALSGATVAVGAGIYLLHRRLRARVWSLTAHGQPGWQLMYTASLSGLRTLAPVVTRALQGGHLRTYVIVIVLCVIGVLGALWLKGLSISATPGTVEVQEGAVVAVMAAAALMAMLVRSRYAAIMALGAVGYGMAVLFAMFGAPDLAMTQFAVETLTLIIFVLVIHRLPGLKDYSRWRDRVRDGTIAGVAGIVVSLTLLATLGVQRSPVLAEYFARTSVLLANGRNVVNVILVDFRGLDTLGEITVLVIAALGVYALLKVRSRGDE